MILQSIILPDSKCLCKNLYYKGSIEFVEQENYMIISEKQRVSFFSYMNMFDAKAWYKYTTLSSVYFTIEAKGVGRLFLKSKTEVGEEILAEDCFLNNETDKWKVYSYHIALTENLGCCYFEIEADSKVIIQNAKFQTDTMLYGKDIRIALNICTFHRKEEIQRNLEQLKRSRFFDRTDELFQKLNFVIVDNGSELEEISEPYMKLVHNPNTGGSGGFKRGLDELRKCKFNITHVVFMDDDVQFFSESLYRLFALLSFMKEEYCNEPIAGRMFRKDNRHIQYTAAEIWNKGDLQHIGLNADMTLETEVLSANDNYGAEYGGWWFCCYPMSFAGVNDPLPFFLHCDDVEYGLRHGGTPIILNGIQVWHETYEYRQSPIITYYDTRNSLIVNEIYNFLPNKEVILKEWKKKISEQHVKKDFLTEKMIILGMWDFLKGPKWLFENKCHKYHKILCKQKGNKFCNAFLWRITTKKFIKKFMR